MLNGDIMGSTLDEFIHHEMLVQPALAVADSPRRVLVVGGGEGATLREVWRPTVERVTMVDIDEGLVHLCKAHLSPMLVGASLRPRCS